MLDGIKYFSVLASRYDHFGKADPSVVGEFRPLQELAFRSPIGWCKLPSVGTEDPLSVFAKLFKCLSMLWCGDCSNYCGLTIVLSTFIYVLERVLVVKRFIAFFDSVLSFSIFVNE